jgi:PAS domain S-box-containing protein
METMTKVLILEHAFNDIELLQYELRKSNLNHITEIVQTKEDYKNALISFNPNIILSDYSFPSFDGLSAFQIKQKVSPGTPFILVSSVIGEENAVELIKMGVTDYVPKDKLYQVAPKIQRALKEAEEREQKELAILQLREKEEQHQKILDLSLDVICTTDEEGRFVTVNAASKLLWGYLPEELIGKKRLDFIHEEDREKSAKVKADIKLGTYVFNYENRFIRKDGGLVTMFWSGRWDPNEKLLYAVGRDATDIKKAENERKIREKRFRTILQNSSDGYVLIAADGTVIERSLSALKMLGLPEDETFGKFRSELIHPEDLPAFNEVHTKVKNCPNAIDIIEFRLLAADGSYKWLEATFHNQLQEPAVGAIVLNLREITERKTVEIALRKSREEYHELFYLSPSPMWVFNVETLQFLDVNEAAIKLYGYSKDEFLNMTIKAIRPQKEAEELNGIINNFKKFKKRRRYIAKHIKKSGEVINVDIRSNWLDINHQEAGLVIATDISQQLKYVHAIEEQNERLREIAWMQSHVVRAPLSRIMGLIDLLKKNQTHTKVSTQDVLGYISTSAHELDKIIREIVKKSEKVKTELMPEEQPKGWD